MLVPMQRSAHAHAHGLPTFKFNVFHWRIEMKLHAKFLRNVAHGVHDGVAAAARMPDSIFIFNKWKNAEEFRAFEWTHSQIFTLKGKRESDLRMLEISTKVVVQTLPRSQLRTRAHVVHRE